MAAVSFSIPRSRRAHQGADATPDAGSRQSSLAFPGIVGNSQALQHVLRQVHLAAPAECSVLIEGETGTGKELIAQAIHELSNRREGPCVKVNCAAIPPGLLESELFGHERGAFTGAIAQKLGRFELADGGTLFLDEIGDIPLELQPKLLRVLQEQEFERLGSARTQRVNVRVVAATHRNLMEMVDQRLFRADLFYRLNVFPVRLPALRERVEDIPLLVRHFTRHYAARLDRSIDVIPDQVMDALMNYHWPGNIRELQNFIERSAILSQGPVLRAPIEELRPAAWRDTGHRGSLDDVQRDHILQTLAETGWVLGGKSGAAARLGMARTTLIHRMHKLGISRAARFV